MNIDYLLLVIDSVEEFFNENFGLALRRKELELHEFFSSGMEEGIFLDLKGSVEGRVVLTYSKHFKMFLANMLLGDFESSSQDEEMREEALKELLNQLAGYIITKMGEGGYNWDIGVPSFFKEWETNRWVGEKIEAVEIPYYDETIGEMKIRIAMKEKEWSKEDAR